MENPTTVKKDPESQCRPRPSTIRSIIDFSRALQVEHTQAEIEVEMIKN